MSAEATTAVLRHARGSDAEWRVLMVIANEANSVGVARGVGLDLLAERTGKSGEKLTEIVRKIRESGQLDGEKLHEYRIVLPGLGEEKPKDRRIPPPAKSSKRYETELRHYVSILSALPMPEQIPQEMLKDGTGFLREGRKAESRLINGEEMAKAVAVLSAFNRLYEWNGRKGSSFKLGRNLTSIVLRIRDVPSWGVEDHVRLVESAWRTRWWEKKDPRRRPTPNVIYGPKAFDQVIQDAREEKEGASGKPARKYTRSGRE